MKSLRSFTVSLCSACILFGTSSNTQLFCGVKNTMEKQNADVFNSEDIDSAFVCTDDVSDFGVTMNGSRASFKMWAPLAQDVCLALYADSVKALDDANAKLVPMEHEQKSGVWFLKDVDVSSFRYYKYKISSGTFHDFVADIWSKACSPDSVASQITDINTDLQAMPQNTSETFDGKPSSYENPFKSPRYTDAVIYEMHIRDWSRAAVKDSTGNFLDIAGSSEIISHLKELGVTHVQFLPMFDYAQTNGDRNYNWGYNPYHYNVPEGRYVTEGYTDGTQAVSEMRKMIAELHANGIAVIMDVVYNHTSGTGKNSLYDRTVPQYFYRMKGNAYSDGSGCGNEVATNHAMVRKYVINSLKHWMLDYHINGFRFDLMGCQEADLMKEIYDELYRIDHSVMVYGEPWTGGLSAVKNGAVTAGFGTEGNGYGAFDDDFRDAIKGAEFSGFRLGQIQGDFNDGGIITGLKGKSGVNHRNETGNTGLSIHYVECHDNYTLFDKLVYSTIAPISGDFAPKFEDAYINVMKNSRKLESVKNQVKLAAAYVVLSQGTPFLNGGQEFMRTKKGNPDSYSADLKGGIQWTNEGGKYNIDAVNTIDLSMKEKYADVYKVYKGLIALRKSNREAFGANPAALARVMKDSEGNILKGLTRYTTGDFLVFFNASEKAYKFSKDDTEGYTKMIDVTDGQPIEKKLPSKVGAKSFLILKR